MKYKVLTTCHAGGKYCREGEIVEFKDEVDNKYLEPVGKKVEVTKKKELKPDQKPLSSLGKKPELKTGMAYKRKKEDSDGF